MGRQKHKPFGYTCCADEAVLLASLACSLEGASLTDTVILGTPAHYTTFFHHAGEDHWFNGKRELFDRATWRAHLAGPPAQDPQTAFDNRLATLDRIVTPQGAYLLSEGRSSIPPARLEAIFGYITDFFGFEPRQLTEARAQPIIFVAPWLNDEPLARLDHLSGPLEARDILSDLANALSRQSL